MRYVAAVVLLAGLLSMPINAIRREVSDLSHQRNLMQLEINESTQQIRALVPR